MVRKGRHLSGWTGTLARRCSRLRYLPVALAELLVDQLLRLLGGCGSVREGLHAALACAADTTVTHSHFLAAHRHLPELAGAALGELESPCTGCWCPGGHHAYVSLTGLGRGLGGSRRCWSITAHADVRG